MANAILVFNLGRLGALAWEEGFSNAIRTLTLRGLTCSRRSHEDDSQMIFWLSARNPRDGSYSRAHGGFDGIYALLQLRRALLLELVQLGGAFGLQGFNLLLQICGQLLEICQLPIV